LSVGGLALCLVVLGGCDNEENSLCDYAPTVVAEADFTTTESGLKFSDLVEGTGDPVADGDFVNVDYIGWLANGSLFDCSYDRGQTFDYTVGGPLPLIDGWQEGILGIRKGGKRQLVIPPELGYGAGGSQTIPPNATLIFELEIVDRLPTQPVD
jgi:FKBP-type peptidyl-prolyl cis-trans isomerase